MSTLSASNDAPIGVFDSGVGGLPILKAIHRLLPNERLVYLADTGYAPYGDKMPVEVVQRVLAIGDWFAAMGVKAIVVACNTASVLAVDVLRARCGVPIIGVEPAIKPAALASRTGVVGVLATARTADSASVARLVDAHGQPNNVQLMVQACPGLVDAIEANAPRVGIKTMLQAWLQPMLDSGADHIVLGCTHYIVVRDVIQDIVGPHVTLVEPSNAVARQLQRKLQEGGVLHNAAAVQQTQSTYPPLRSQVDRHNPQMFSSADLPNDAAALISHVWGEQVLVHSALRVVR